MRRTRGRRRWPALILCIIGVSCARHSVSGTRAIPGGGTLRDIARSGGSDAFTNAMKVPGADLVATGVTWRNGDLILIGADGRSVAEIPADVDELAPGHDRGQFLLHEGNSFRLLKAPDLNLVSSVEFHADSDVRRFGPHGDLCRVRTGWCLLAHRGELLEIRSYPFALGRRASMDMSSAIQCAFDAKTDCLVVIGKKGEIRVLDWKTLQVVHGGRVPDTKFAFSVCAHGGTAWIATQRGSFVQYDIAANVVRSEIHLTKTNGSVQLALSESGTRLAATSSVFVPGTDHPTVLTVWDVGAKGLTLRARAETNLNSTIWHIGLFEEQDKLFIACSYPGHIWSYGSARAP